MTKRDIVKVEQISNKMMADLNSVCIYAIVVYNERDISGNI